MNGIASNLAVFTAIWIILGLALAWYLWSILDDKEKEDIRNLKVLVIVSDVEYVSIFMAILMFLLAGMYGLIATILGLR